MSSSSKLVSNHSRTFLKVAIALVFISKLQQEKALQQPTVARAFLMLFRAIATATSPQTPSTKSGVVQSRRRRILSSLLYKRHAHYISRNPLISIEEPTFSLAS